MGLAHLLLEHFRDGFKKGGVAYPYSLLDFIHKHPEWGPRISQMSHYSRRLENENLLNHMGTTNGPNPYYVHHYYTNRAIYEEELGLYGSYDMLVEGFLSIRNRFAPLVLPISVQIKDGDFSIGTSFVYRENILITAKHCLEGVQKATLQNTDGKPLIVKKVILPKDERIDIAIIELQKPEFSAQHTITLSIREEWQGVGEMDELNFLGEKSITVLAPGKILDDILTLGYPPISGFESILIADKAAINSTFFRSSEGQILAAETKYVDAIEYLLINAKVKGGNSGGPVIDKLGRIVGMVVQMPHDIKNPEALDRLGYGLAIPSSYIKGVLNGYYSGDGTVFEVDVIQGENNSFMLK